MLVFVGDNPKLRESTESILKLLKLLGIKLVTEIKSFFIDISSSQKT